MKTVRCQMDYQSIAKIHVLEKYVWKSSGIKQASLSPVAICFSYFAKNGAHTPLPAYLTKTIMVCENLF